MASLDIKETPSEDHVEEKTHQIENIEDRETQNKYAAKGDESDGRVEMTLKRFLAMAHLCMAYSGATVPLLFITSSLLYVEADIPHPGVRGWAGTVYGIALASIAPFCGYLQDLVGRRYIMLAGQTVIIVGMVIVGAAHHFSQLIVGLVFTGFGAGITELGALAGVAEVVSVKNRGLAIAFTSALLMPFTPYVLYAGLLSTKSTWRWTMWISVIWNGWALAGLTLFYFPKSHRRAGRLGVWKILREIDYIGGALSIGGIVLFLVGIQAGSSGYAWTSAVTLAPLLVGIVLIFIFVFYEWKFARFPMVPAAIFQGQRVVGPALGVSFTIGMNLYAILSFLPLLLSTVYNPDPIEVGLKAIGYALGQTIFASLGNMAVTYLWGHQRGVILSGCIGITIFIGALAALDPTNPALAVGLSTVAGVAVGWVIAPINTVALTGTPDMFIATVVALNTSIRFLGGAVGYSIYYAIFSDKLKKKLPVMVATAVAQAGLAPNLIEQFVGTFLTKPAAIATLEGVTPAIIAAASEASRWAYSDSLKYVWYTSIPFGVLSIGACLLMENTKQYVTNRVAATLE